MAGHTPFSQVQLEAIRRDIEKQRAIWKEEVLAHRNRCEEAKQTLEDLQQQLRARQKKVIILNLIALCINLVLVIITALT